MTEINSRQQEKNNESLDFRLKSFNEGITRALEKELKNNGEEILVLGYVRVPRIINRETLDRVRAYSEMVFDGECGVCPIHPNDVLSDIRGKKVHVDTDVRYCIIYRQD